MDRARPQPITITDELLVHVLDALGEIRDRLPAAPQGKVDGRTDVSEPAKTPRKTTTSRRNTEEKS